MLNLRAVFGVAGGLLFGLVWVWQGVGAAFTVLAFTVLGWFIAYAVLIGKRAAAGEIDMGAVRELISTVFSEKGRTR